MRKIFTSLLIIVQLMVEYVCAVAVKIRDRVCHRLVYKGCVGGLDCHVEESRADGYFTVRNRGELFHRSPTSRIYFRVANRYLMRTGRPLIGVHALRLNSMMLEAGYSPVSITFIDRSRIHRQRPMINTDVIDTHPDVAKRTALIGAFHRWLDAAFGVPTAKRQLPSPLVNVPYRARRLTSNVEHLPHRPLPSIPAAHRR